MFLNIIKISSLAIVGIMMLFSAKIYSSERQAIANAQLAMSKGYYFSAIPYMKEFLYQNRGRVSDSEEKLLEKLITVVGTSQFETLSTQALSRSRSNSVAFILGKRWLKKGKWSKAKSYLGAINPNHPLAPFALNLLAVAESNQGKYEQAAINFRKCAKASTRSSADNSSDRRNQLEINHDLCIMGQARTSFAQGDFPKADLTYLDIEKSSPLWPEVVFEEAWTSYYQQNFNRTLGKLVTYRAPVFYYYFNPETAVLQALSFYKMCLYDDVKLTVSKFYAEYYQESQGLKRYLKKHRRDSDYYRLVIDRENQVTTQSLVDRLLAPLFRDGFYKQVRSQLVMMAQRKEILLTRIPGLGVNFS